MPRRIQRQRRKGWRRPAHAVCVTRPGHWGNPLKIGKDGDRAQLLALFADYARARLAAEPEWLASLRGKDLACWCAEGDACHADLLLRPAPPHHQLHLVTRGQHRWEGSSWPRGAGRC